MKSVSSTHKRIEIQSKRIFTHKYAQIRIQLRIQRIGILTKRLQIGKKRISPYKSIYTQNASASGLPS